MEVRGITQETKHDESMPLMVTRLPALRQASKLAFSTGARIATDSASMVPPAPRAALCVIGNEVLSGKGGGVVIPSLACYEQTQDTNSHFVAQFMFQRGIDLTRIVVIPDELDTISSTVKELSDLVGPSGYVITTGGIGPTHDDITYEGVANAFGTTVELHQPTLDGLRNAMLKRGRPASELNDDRKRMAMLPIGCKILSTDSWVPIAVMKNVYVLPGIPKLVRSMLTYNEDHFQGEPIHRLTVFTMQFEGDLARELGEIQDRYPNVAIGSYVNLSEDKAGTRDLTFNTKLTIDGRDATEVEQVAQEIAATTNGFRSSSA